MGDRTSKEQVARIVGALRALDAYLADDTLARRVRRLEETVSRLETEHARRAHPAA